jgi:hypothetical protein
MPYTAFKYVNMQISYILKQCEQLFRRYIKEFMSALKFNGKCELEEIGIKFLSRLFNSCGAILVTLTLSLRNSEGSIVLNVEHLST